MQLSSDQTDVESLTLLGQKAIGLVQRRDFAELVKQFGYALSHGRDPVRAIEDDFAQCLADACGPSGGTEQAIKVSYFKPNDIELFALVKCVIPITSTQSVLMELIVTGGEADRYITLEQISYVT
jgi:hypothetical protein